jgi:hypothetical protein
MTTCTTPEYLLRIQETLLRLHTYNYSNQIGDFRNFSVVYATQGPLSDTIDLQRLREMTSLHRNQVICSAYVLFIASLKLRSLSITSLYHLYIAILAQYFNIWPVRYWNISGKYFTDFWIRNTLVCAKLYAIFVICFSAYVMADIERSL